MKRIISLLLILLMVLSACKANSDPADDPVVTEKESDTEVDKTTEEEPEEKDEKEPEEESEEEPEEIDVIGRIIGGTDDCYYVAVGAAAYRVTGDFEETYERHDDVRIKGYLKTLDAAVSYNGFIVRYVIDDADITCMGYDNTEDQAKGAKPVIYLYPEKSTDVSVSVNLNGRLTCVYPEYNGEWNVNAAPDGTLTDSKGREYYCLYWEGEFENSLVPDKNVGFMVKGEDTAEFLRQKALQLGLNEREANEFIIYWLPQMEPNAYNYVYFATDTYTREAALSISPTADTEIRFMMVWEALDTPYEVIEQTLPDTPKRDGFVAVEWGGMEID